MNIQRKLSNGTMWADTKEFTDKYIDGALAKEAEAKLFIRSPKREFLVSKAEILDYLASGKTLKYGDDWYAELRDADAAKWQPKLRTAQAMTRCECGHDVPAGTAMSSSRGTCCPGCYDRMSD